MSKILSIGGAMSFREKSAWITLVSMLLCSGVYFTVLLSGVMRPGWGLLHVFLACVLALVVLQVGLRLVAAASSPREARAPRDERERLILWRSQSLGYWVLVVAVLAMFIPGHMGFGPFELMNFALFDVVLAAVVASAAQIVMFRRGG